MQFPALPIVPSPSPDRADSPSARHDRSADLLDEGYCRLNIMPVVKSFVERDKDDQSNGGASKYSHRYSSDYPLECSTARRAQLARCLIQSGPALKKRV